ncbi:uncharacterized protein LOC134726347 [Mytilus trossulus]|uniref:uncharacterized protein LOC134726347 n=1 Tax=Mytilus trossulus TaxID=6551 RepID=UPI003005FF90
MNGRRVSGLLLESLDGSTKMQLPTVIECKEIPNNRDEIPTPDVANYHDHLRSISHELEPLDENADILLLIGRDLLEAHHIIEQRIGPAHSPYAQRLALGWVIIGDVCIGNRHVTDSVKSYKTYIQAGGRPSLLKPCPNVISVRELLKTQNKLDNIDFDLETKLGDGVFDRTEFDDTPGKSIEDKIFLDIMEKEFHKNEHGNWCAPLPFKPNRERLPNNFPMALRRAKTLDRSLQSNKEKREHFLEFMHNLIQNNHAEIAPKLDEGAESWYLPVFGIYHPKKPGKIRCVFDSSAKFGDVSLNKVLLQGPDLNNSLLSVLMRFRKNRVAASADVQQMFYSFSVDEKHRDFLRFIWHEDNNLDKQLVDFRMTVHVFGNSPSPAVVTYGLRKCSNLTEPDVRDFIQRHFYVDDGLISLDSSQDMIDLLTRTQKTLLKEGNIRLHKFASNSDEVMSALPHEDLTQDLKSIDFDADSVPLQRSLGLYWDLATDCFTYRISEESKPFTRRGVLSTLNSLFDPLGFVAPVIVEGKIILRELMAQSVDWDEPLPENSKLKWETWRKSLSALQNITIPRMYVSSSLSKTPTFELHVFADASEKAIAAVSYLRTIKPDGNTETGFILGKAKVAPHHGHTIPRLELCAAVLAVDVSKTVVENFDETFDVVKFYTDSKVVLGYIYNQTRRFYVYVEHRIERIRKSTVPEQWNYVPTSVNPADQATRSVSSEDIGSSSWLQGPTKFISGELQASASTETLTILVNPDLYKEVRPIVTVTKTTIEDSHSIGSERFQNFSSWKSLVNGIAVLQRFIQSRFKKVTLQDIDVVKSLNESEIFIIKTIQSEAYSSEIDCIVNGQNLRKNSSIISLDPFLDSEGILRVGGRLNKSNLPYQERNPLILPGKCHVSKLLVQHFHAQVKHQGRHFTEGAIRAEGYWITGSKRLVSSVIHHCVPCRKLRGCLEVQKMADLPTDRIEPTPPFTNVGVDAFGPWSVIHRRTRGGCSNSKRWAILFTCLTTRAIHIEIVEEMSSSAFINALRRFIAIRGKVSVFRSDRGSNFIGAVDPLHIEAINVEDDKVKTFMHETRTIWIFNPPHSSHMGGAGERLIGVTRRILDSILTDANTKFLTHNVLVTFMAEVASIVNHRPIVPVSSDTDNPFILSPAVLLTQKTKSTIETDYIGEFDTKDLLHAEWKRVMVLSDMFWSRWRKEYLNNLQSRRKWHKDVPNIKEGDVVLLRDKTLIRNEWPLGLVIRAFASDDGKVRKTELRVIRDGKPTVYVRPITELVLLVSDREQCV